MTHEKILCPACNTILDSLAVRDPDLAATWHPDNEKTPWQVLPCSNQLAHWLCADNPGHTWVSRLSARSSGTGCPLCTTAGTSIPEQLLIAALTAAGTPTAAAKIRRTCGTGSWRIDGTAVLPDGRDLLVEYDGAYWHTGKTDVDLRKTIDLLSSGALVARVREHPLPNLPLDAPGLLQIQFRPQTDTYEMPASEIIRWSMLPT